MRTARRRLVCVALLCFSLMAAGASTPTTAKASAPAEHLRGVEQTFLTYPEWFLVFSPAEYAHYVARSSPDTFPFLGHVGQFWHGYAAVTRESHARGAELNPGYHLMVMVIGVSTSIEYALRSVYEGLWGRLSQATSSAPTAEDQHAARAAKAYVDFIRELPWYQYDFKRDLKALWTEVPWTGPDMLRKWERRFALTTEYGIKGLYGQLIKIATGSIYDKPLPVTAVVVRPAPQPDANLPELRVLDRFVDGDALVTVPRYGSFTTYAKALAGKGIDFSEIAGNRSIILVSLIGPDQWRPSEGIDKLLFEQPILTEPGRKRIVSTVKVGQLAAALREWASAGVQVEHLFDY